MTGLVEQGVHGRVEADAAGPEAAQMLQQLERASAREGCITEDDIGVRMPIEALDGGGTTESGAGR